MREEGIKAIWLRTYIYAGDSTWSIFSRTW